MKTAIGQIQDILEEALPFLARYLGESPAQELAEFVSKRATDATPTVMVFGVYNAGKSTLLNALTGEEQAAVSDRPETSVVTPYYWRGFTLLDTPGIDAPKEHEVVSRDQLDRSDVVLFVLSNNGVSDEHSVYNEILDIAIIGKPVMLIINNKAGYHESDFEYQEIYDQIQRNLELVAQKRGHLEIAHTIPIWLVNARSALNGRLKNKEALIKASGLPALERAIEALLRRCGTHEIAITLRDQVSKLVNLAIEKIDTQEAQAEAQLISALQKAVQGEKDRATAVVLESIRRASMRFRTDFRAAIDAADENRMRSAFETAISNVTQAIERELTVSSTVLSKLGSDLDKSVSFQVNAGENDATFGGHAFGTADEGINIDFSAANPVYDLMRNLTSKISREGLEQATKTAVHEALKLAKDWVPSLMKGIGEKTMEKIAQTVGATLGKATPFIGPTIDTVRAIVNYRQETEKQLEYARQREQQMRQLATLIEQRAQDLAAELDAAGQAILIQAFQPLESALTEKAQTLTKNQRILVMDRQSLTLLQTRLEMISTMPTSAVL